MERSPHPRAGFYTRGLMIDREFLATAEGTDHRPWIFTEVRHNVANILVVELGAAFAGTLLVCPGDLCDKCRERSTCPDRKACRTWWQTPVLHHFNIPKSFYRITKKSRCRWHNSDGNWIWGFIQRIPYKPGSFDPENIPFLIFLSIRPAGKNYGHLQLNVEFYN